MKQKTIDTIELELIKIRDKIESLLDTIDGDREEEDEEDDY